MSQKLRDELVENISSRWPKLRKFLRQDPNDISVSWDMVAWSYQLAFDEMWDLARGGKHMLVRPLLSLCRQSIELTIKSALKQIKGDEPEPGHDLITAFRRLENEIRRYEPEHDEYDVQVSNLIREIQSFDVSATRFRYPTQKGRYFDGLDVDLDELFQAHWIIVTWCEGSALELGRKYGVGEPDV